MNINTDNEIKNNPIHIKYTLPSLSEHFDFTENLWKGGFGTVFPCRIKGTKEFNLVIKTCNDTLNAKNDTELKKSFKEEMLFNLKMNRHPNVVYTSTAAQENGRYYMIMELVGKPLQKADDKIPDNTLLAYLNKQKKLEGDIKTVRKQYLLWLIQACDGLNYIYKVPVKKNQDNTWATLSAHNDIKPNNFLISKDKVLKVADFGYSFYNSYTKRNRGTDMYAAPELLEGKAADVCSDIYALGIILYQLFNNGEYPAVETDAPGEATLMNKKSAVYDDIYQKCCAKDPRKRYQNLKALRRDLEEKYGAKIPVAKEGTMPPEFYALKANGFFDLEDYENALINVNKAEALGSKMTFKQYMIRIISNYELNRPINNNDIDKIINDPYVSNENKGLAHYFQGFILLEQLTPQDQKDFLETTGEHAEEAALDEFNKAIELGSDAGMAYFGKAVSYFRLTKWKEAVQSCNNALAENFQHKQIYFMRGVANTEKIKMVLFYYKDVLKLQMPTAIIAGIKNIAQQICEDLTIAEKNGIRSEKVFFALAFAQNILGRKEECRENSQWAFRFLWKSPISKEEKAQYFFALGEFCLETDDKKTGVESFKLAKELEPSLMPKIELLCYDKDKDDWVDEIDTKPAP